VRSDDNAAAEPGPQRERTVAGIVACVVPAVPALDAAARAAALSDVTRFVHLQIRALPDFLRVPYQLALVGFDWLAVLRWGRPFRALDAERRAAWVALWSDAPLALPRSFLRLIRGCALLAWYDHPALLAALGGDSHA
jgi:hypothetical protein